MGERDLLDLSIGEARLVRSALEGVFGLELFHRTADDELDYQPAQGNPILLSELERLHSAPCVVTAGAKQGVFVALMVARDRGCEVVGMRDPAWPPLVDAIRSLGMTVRLCEPEEDRLYDCFLLVSPNNPDGTILSSERLLAVEASLRDRRFLIHDAAYACAPYMESACPVVGDAQIHSVSKRYGLSGVRVGWAVSRDEETIASLQHAVEIVSSGVSGTAQGAIARLLKRARSEPTLARLFEERSRDLLRQSREAATRFDPRVLEADMRLNEGAFAWCRKGPSYDAGKLRVRLIDGAAYGYPQHVRINLVGGLEAVRELARRTWTV